MLWAAIGAGALCCYLLKLGGLSVPERVLRDPRIQKVAALLPVALLAGLMAIQAFSSGQQVVLDDRAVGLSVALLLVILRAPFLAVVVGAALATALLRALIP
ncbi:branched-chain amino acid transporter AzlD [Sphaerisporangium melleum]|uniref:Branched-chain amino acid transporter AzlD n=1 Tax=Sphaerisporangium melleum TaxID=321316 RepID=A0A917RRS3_9ACTN|nr:AzlD domain-containing protein [Sphaerisporangium melleum]GGL19058.1 branched-chain amino acid transporter AzlD [Sphaerisporangium melleum]GII71139.1 branched-chain amino acid transporter AzlD [Sphaerisporangium melleum]